MITYNYLSQLKDDLVHWQKAGIIDRSRADLILDDLAARKKSRSFGTVIALLGATLMTFGIIAFVASNWNAIGDMTRFGMIVAFLLSAYAAAWFSYKKNFPALSHAFLVIAIAAFGGGIMLTGQIFHLQGSTADALFVWLLGAGITVFATRSYAAAVAMVCVLITWISTEFWGQSDPRMFLGVRTYIWFPLVWMGAAALVWWVSSRLAAHMLAIAMLFWLCVMPFMEEMSVIVVYSIVYILVALSLASYSTGQYLKGFEVPIISYCFVVLLGYGQILQWSPDITYFSRGKFGFPNDFYVLTFLAIAATLAIAFALRSRGVKILRDQYVIPIALFLPVLINVISPVAGNNQSISLLNAAVGLFMAIWAVRFGWRIESRILSALGYISFIVLLFSTYAILFGSLEFTAAVYAVAGIGLLGLSFWMLKREKKSDQLEES